MAPLPKRRYAKARQGERRSHLALSKPALESCSHCHSPKLNHHVCPTCGYYDGKEAIKVGKVTKENTKE